MRIETFPDAPPPSAEQRLYETVGAMRIDPAASLAFGTGSADLVLRGDLESLNFVDCAAGTRWAEQAARPGLLTVIDEHGADITDRFFVRDGDGLALKGPATPAMITRDETIVRQDCLGYLMRRL